MRDDGRDDEERLRMEAVAELMGFERVEQDRAQVLERLLSAETVAELGEEMLVVSWAESEARLEEMMEDEDDDEEEPGTVALHGAEALTCPVTGAEVGIGGRLRFVEGLGLVDARATLDQVKGHVRRRFLAS